MKPYRALTIAAALTAGLTAGIPPAQAQPPTDSHTVTIIILERHDIRVIGGDIVIDITPPPGGGDPPAVTNSTCDLVWSSNRNNRKRITVESDLMVPVVPLTVQALNVKGTGVFGTPAPGPVPLGGGVAWDLLTNVRRCRGQCDLLYSADAPAGPAPLTEVHTVTYTFVMH